jgi:hypothetical protein
MIRLDKEIAVLVISFFALCVVAAIMTANSNSIISAIQDPTDKTPMERLIDNIPANGCMLENITDIPNSPVFNNATDHRLSIICVE